MPSGAEKADMQHPTNPGQDTLEPHKERWHIRHPHRMPAFGMSKNRIVGSSLEGVFTSLADLPGTVRRGRTLDSTKSPAGMVPLTEGVREHLQRLYDELRGDDEELSREKFENFIRDEQMENKKPSFAFSPKRTSFKYQDFQELWWNEYSAAKRPVHFRDKDLDKPISNYFISSSHNTYIEDGNQFSGLADADQYKKVLEAGCRCVEIDVWDGAPVEAGSSNSLATRKSATSTQSNKEKRHWSFASLVPWMRKRCSPSSSSQTLESKPSQASLKAPLKRARELSDATAKKLELEPRVCHAYHALGSDVRVQAAIPLRKVCQIIRDHAFTKGNDLPLIISLEVKASLPQQEMMVKIMEHEFGDLLLKAPLPHRDPQTTQPTLRDLRGKILIKTRTGPRGLSPAVSEAGSTLQGSEPSERCVSLRTKSRQPSSGSSRSPRHHHPEEPAKVSDAVKKLAVYTYGPGRFENLRTAKDGDHPAHIYSIGEDLLKHLHRTEHSALFTHNKSFLTRSYPEGLASYDSSNPNPPTMCWRKGVQMVALNWQRWDTAMELNSAMFDHENGWVLKPEGYRGGGGAGTKEPDAVANANCQAGVAGKKRMDLTITVLAGQFLPIPAAEDSRTRLFLSDSHDPGFRPKVTCFLHSESAAERNPKKAIGGREYISRSTRLARTDNPSWGASGSKLHFPNVRHVVEELSFVRINVDDCRHYYWRTRSAWACIRLDRLQEGYRMLKLKTDDGLTCDGMLLVRVEKTLVAEPQQPRPSSLSRKTWNECKDGVVQLKSKWSCLG